MAKTDGTNHFQPVGGLQMNHLTLAESQDRVNSKSADAPNSPVSDTNNYTAESGLEATPEGDTKIEPVLTARRYSDNREIQATIERLLALGCPPLPVAPAQPADLYPARDKTGQIKIDDAGNPMPAFTGKNPSFLDPDGVPHLIAHGKFQSVAPTDRELQIWFANPLNGVGTLGGHGGIVWLDPDAKQFSSVEECVRVVMAFIAANDLGDGWIERTGGGGFRIGIIPKNLPTFTNFAFSEGGTHVGEALHSGKFVVLAPTVHPNGRAYERLSDGNPIEVESLESIGIFSTAKKRLPVQRRERTQATMVGAIPLEQLGNSASRDVLSGIDTQSDRSASLTTMFREFSGWENWADSNRIPYSGSAVDLAHVAGAALGLDADRVDRILKTVDPDDCRPAAQSRGDDTSCWKRIWKIDRPTFEQLCPPLVQSQIKTDFGFNAGQGFGKPIAQTAENNLVPFPGADQPEPIDKSEVDQAIERSQTMADVAGLLPSLYQILQTKALRFNIPVETFVAGLLPIGGSLLASSTRLEIEVGYNVPPIVWACVVGDSGAAKTPGLQAVAAPLQSLQSVAYKHYESDRKFYEKQLRDWTKNRQGDEPEEPEKLRHYYSPDSTMESLIQIVAAQPDHGLVVAVDELKVWLKSFGEYKGGAGGDLPRWLTTYNGLPIKSDRKTSGTQMAERANISVVGTIQPSVLRKLISETEEVDGFWSRLMIFGVPTTVMPAPGEVPAIDISDILEGIYIRLSSYPAQTHSLSAQALTIYVQWHHWTETRKMVATSQAEQALYPKIREQAARVALIAHNLEAAARGVMPSAEISAETMTAAISLAKYCLGQALLIYGGIGATSDNPEAIRIANFIERFAGQTVDWKRVRPILPKTRVGKTRRAANKIECVEFLRRVVEMGYGVDQTGDCASIVVNDRPAETEITYSYTAPDEPEDDDRATEVVAVVEPEVLVSDEPLVSSRRMSAGGFYDRAPEKLPIDELEGFSVGDRVQCVTPEWFDKRTVKESRRAKEAPYDEFGTVTGFVSCTNMVTGAPQTDISVEWDSPEIPDRECMADWLKIVSVGSQEVA